MGTDKENIPGTCSNPWSCFAIFRPSSLIPHLSSFISHHDRELAWRLRLFSPAPNPGKLSRERGRLLAQKRCTKTPTCVHYWHLTAIPHRGTTSNQKKPCLARYCKFANTVRPGRRLCRHCPPFRQAQECGASFGERRLIAALACGRAALV